MAEQCPACDDYQGVGDYDTDCGKFYTCLACGYRWSYADENRPEAAAAPDECCNGAARRGRWGCDTCGREWT